MGRKILKQKAEECKKEVQAILDKHNCTLMGNP